MRSATTRPFSPGPAFPTVRASRSGQCSRSSGSSRASPRTTRLQKRRGASPPPSAVTTLLRWRPHAWPSSSVSPTPRRRRRKGSGLCVVCSRLLRSKSPWWWYSTTSTGPSRRCSISSSTLRSGRATRRSCSWRWHGPTCSTRDGPGEAGSATRRPFTSSPSRPSSHSSCSRGSWEAASSLRTWPRASRKLPKATRCSSRRWFRYSSTASIYGRRTGAGSRPEISRVSRCRRAFRCCWRRVSISSPRTIAR